MTVRLDKKVLRKIVCSHILRQNFTRGLNSSVVMEVDMGDIFKAYQQLDKALNLGLSKDRLGAMRAEGKMKFDFAEVMGYKVDQNFLQDWEFVVSLVPRRKALTSAQKTLLVEVQKSIAPNKRTVKTTKKSAKKK